MPKLEYPAIFDKVVGIKVTEDIPNREAFMFVPYKMIYTLEKVILKNQILVDIIKKNPNLFNIEINEDVEVDFLNSDIINDDYMEHLCLVLGLFYEIA